MGSLLHLREPRRWNSADDNPDGLTTPALQLLEESLGKGAPLRRELIDAGPKIGAELLMSIRPVSYTHLTLPTILRV